jgi:hypothetical protein
MSCWRITADKRIVEPISERLIATAMFRDALDALCTRLLARPTHRASLLHRTLWRRRRRHRTAVRPRAARDRFEVVLRRFAADAAVAMPPAKGSSLFDVEYAPGRRGLRTGARVSVRRGEPRRQPLSTAHWFDCSTTAAAITSSGTVDPSVETWHRRTTQESINNRCSGDSGESHLGPFSEIGQSQKRSHILTGCCENDADAEASLKFAGTPLRFRRKRTYETPM